MSLTERRALAKVAIFWAACLAAWILGATWRFEGLAGLRAVLIGLPLAFLLMAGEELEGDGPPFALFTARLTTTQAEQLSAPDVMPHVPYLSVMVLVVIVVALWKSPVTVGAYGEPC